MRFACCFLSSAMVSGLCSYMYPVCKNSARDYRNRSYRNRSLGLSLYQRGGGLRLLVDDVPQATYAGGRRGPLPENDDWPRSELLREEQSRICGVNVRVCGSTLRLQERSFSKEFERRHSLISSGSVGLSVCSPIALRITSPPHAHPHTSSQYSQTLHPVSPFQCCRTLYQDHPSPLPVSGSMP
jgi:hypothetical protein